MVAEFKERFERRHEIGREVRKQGGKIVACFYGLVPRELIHAANVLPVQLIEERRAEFESRSGLLPFLCGMSKNLAGQLYAGAYDYLDGLMVATVCDTNRHVFDIWAHRRILPHMWLVRTPSTATSAAVGYYAGDLRRLAGELERVSGQAVTEERLARSIRLYNESRSLFRRFYEARPGTPISAEEALYVFGSALVSPVEEHNDLMRKLLGGLPAASPSPGHGPRLMLSAINLNMAWDVARMARQYGGAVVTDDFTHNARYGSSPIDEKGDPFEALARGYLRRVPAPGIYSFEERATEIRTAMEQARADGLIYLIQLYCDAYAMEYAILKERLDAWGVRHLKLEAEDTPSSMEQLNVRVQSFVESLG